MNKLKRLLLRVVYSFPGWIKKTIYNIYDYYKYPNLREKKMEFGPLNKNIIFYVIRPYANSNEGLMSLLLNVCRQIVYAEKKGYTPVVDFKNYKTQYSDERNVNIWEDYFEQLTPYSLEEVYYSKHVVLCGLKPTREEIFEPYRRFTDADIKLAKSIFKKYIRVNKKVYELLDQEEKNINPKASVGVYMRGTDYVATKPIGHFIQPTANQIIPLIDKKLENTVRKDIYLVTEDQKIYNHLYEEYGTRIKTVSFDKFISNYNKEEGYLFQSKKISEISGNKYERGLFYLIKELLLSRCSCIIGGNTCGSWAAVIFSNDNTHYQIITNGKY